VYPKAWIKLTELPDTIVISDINAYNITEPIEFTDFTSGGEETKTHSLTAQFAMGSENVTFEIGYEECSGSTADGAALDMPYYKLTGITQQSVTPTYLGTENYHEIYDMVAIYTVDMESVNVPEDKKDFFVLGSLLCLNRIGAG